VRRGGKAINIARKGLDMPSISQTTISPVSGKKRRRDDDASAQVLKILR
jgi:hypothetical protein